jgi:hypothetical protein
MIPAIWPGDVLTVVPTTPSTPAPGDVALTAMHGRLVAHRVIERGALGGAVALVTRGDALEREDPLTTGDAILGTVVARNGRGIRAAWAGRSRPSVNLARLLVRSTLLLAMTLKVRALIGRLVRAAV